MKLIKNLAVLILSLCVFTSCQNMVEQVQTKINSILHPSASPEMIAQVKAMADKVAFKQPEKLWRSGTSRMDLEAGQWVTTLTTHTDEQNDCVLSTTRVISMNGSTVVLETESYSAMDTCERNMVQMTIENFPVEAKLTYTQDDVNQSIQAMKVTKVLVKHGIEPAQELPAPALAMYQQMSKTMTGVNVISGEMASEACSTPYIESAKCYSFDFSVTVMGITATGRSTVHSKIPVTGLVKTESNNMVQETIAFGTNGAVSQF